MTSPRQGRAASCRVTVVLDHPAQHFAWGFSLLSREQDLDVEVIYWDVNEGGYHDQSFGRHVEWDGDLLSTYPHWSPTGSSTARAAQVLRRLAHRRPDVLLCFGWATRVSRLAIVFATLLHVPLLYYGDSTWQHSTRPRLGGVRRQVLRRLFSRSASAALSTGTFNRDFYVLNGMRPDRVFRGVCPADTRLFIDAAQRRDASELSGADRGQQAVSIAFAGKFIDRKAPSHLIAAVAGLPVCPPWHLTMIGDGALRSDCEQMVGQLGLSDHVTFSGFKNSSEMPAILAAVDVLVVPSTRDLRILIATEAMSAGAVPVVSSATAVWGVNDLVEDDVTGVVYPVGDIKALHEVLRALVCDTETRHRLSAAATTRALEQDSDDFARLAAAAIRALVPRGTR